MASMVESGLSVAQGVYSVVEYGAVGSNPGLTEYSVAFIVWRIYGQCG